MKDQTTAIDENTLIVRAERRARRYDEERGCYVYDVSFKTSSPLTERTVGVSKAFGLGVGVWYSYGIATGSIVAYPQPGLIFDILMLLTFVWMLIWTLRRRAH